MTSRVALLSFPLTFAALISSARVPVDFVNHTVFSPDAKWVAVGYNDKYYLHSLPSNKLVATFPEPPGSLGVTFSPCGKYFVSVGRDESENSIVVWDLSTMPPKILKQLAPRGKVAVAVEGRHAIKAFAFSADSKVIYTVHGTGVAKTWDWKNENEPTAFAEFSLQQFDVAHSLASTRVAIFLGNERMEIWDFARFPPRLAGTGHCGIEGTYLSRDTTTLAHYDARKMDSPLYVYELREGRTKLIREVKVEGRPWGSVTCGRDMFIGNSRKGLSFYPLSDAKRRELGLESGQSRVTFTNYLSIYGIKSDDDRWLLLSSAEFPYRAVPMSELLKGIHGAHVIRE